MIDIEALKHEIVACLKPLDPDKIILFGSYAYGTPDEDSDIDLYVVTKDDFMPQNWREKSEVYAKVSSAIRDIMQRYPTDLITHTKAMHTKFLEMDSMFSRKIMKDGVQLV
ncbi:MAG: nucleotidyltransferase domain-containing protein [Sulfurimonas sp.]|uniref:nucleotidyltransferase domain-containing protein n=1 Tax=Sulfurimonas sp. TaxID=2022749 RepID=UPI00262C9733|nr:nucleotidyltransferase domain-containing protein [Sulfurimonas sp.]MDD5373624.1 nucleotidyltransferase domain-containing protein [Sulfurimonas sp.]